MAEALFVFEGGPTPPPGQYWCSVCAAMLRAAINADPDVQKRIEWGNAHKPGELCTIKIPPKFRSYPMQIAVTRMVYLPFVQLFPGAVFDVCWSHVSGVQFSSSGVLPAAASQMPTGAVALDGSRRRIG